MGAFLTYALDEGGALVHVDDVPKGAKCACRCPHCKAPLYAKNSGRWPEPGTRRHHFAHANGKECEGAFESQLHLLAKEVLQEAGIIMLPRSIKGQFPSGRVRIRNIEKEKWDDCYHIRPDIEGIMDNGERLLIEFFVSHKVDDKKRQVIVENHLKCIEIDINYQALDKAQLKKFLTDTDEDRNWIVPIPPLHKPSVESISYGSNPMYEKIKDIIKRLFDEGSLTIHPYSLLLSKSDKPINLREEGYDICDINKNYRGFKSDLLLYSSNTEKKGYISIIIRSRRRYNDYKRPQDLRVIDIILSANASIIDIQRQWENGDLSSNNNVSIEYKGFLY